MDAGAQEASTGANGPRAGRGRRDRILAAVIILVMAAAIGVLIRMSLAVETAERFTEFYILSSRDTADDYPVEVTIGQESVVKVGIVNHEREVTAYRMEVVVDGETAVTVGPIPLGPGEKWEQPVTYSHARAGPGQEVAFRLYRLGQVELYRSLFLRVNVNRPG